MFDQHESRKYHTSSVPYSISSPSQNRNMSLQQPDRSFPAFQRPSHHHHPDSPPPLSPGPYPWSSPLPPPSARSVPVLAPGDGDQQLRLLRDEPEHVIEEAAQAAGAVPQRARTDGLLHERLNHTVPVQGLRHRHLLDREGTYASQGVRHRRLLDGGGTNGRCPPGADEH